MIKKIIISLIIIAVLPIYNYVFAKYKEEQYIHIAEVNIQKKQARKYNLKVYYMDKENNNALNVKISRVYEGSTYKVEILEFEGYTYEYSDKDLSGIMEGNTNIFLYYTKN